MTFGPSGHSLIVSGYRAQRAESVSQTGGWSAAFKIQPMPILLDTPSCDASSFAGPFERVSGLPGYLPARGIVRWVTPRLVGELEYRSGGKGGTAPQTTRRMVRGRRRSAPEGSEAQPLRG